MRFLHRRRHAAAPIELNVIPLIDVVFFLLCIAAGLAATVLVIDMKKAD